MSFNEWFLDKVSGMALNYEDRLNKLESEIKALRAILQNLHVESETTVHDGYGSVPDVDVDSAITVKTQCGSDVHISEVFYYCKMCQNCSGLLLFDDNNCIKCKRVVNE